MPAPTSGGLGSTNGGRHERAALHPRDGVGEPGEAGNRPDRRLPTFAHRVGERHEVVVVRVGRQWTGMADQFPTAGGGDAPGVHDA